MLDTFFLFLPRDLTVNVSSGGNRASVYLTTGLSTEPEFSGRTISFGLATTHEPSAKRKLRTSSPKQISRSSQSVRSLRPREGHFRVKRRGFSLFQTILRRRFSHQNPLERPGLGYFKGVFH